MEGMLNTLLPLHEMMEKNGPTTLKEIAFVQAYGRCGTVWGRGWLLQGTLKVSTVVRRVEKNGPTTLKETAFVQAYGRWEKVWGRKESHPVNLEGVWGFEEAKVVLLAEVVFVQVNGDESRRWPVTWAHVEVEEGWGCESG